MANRFTRQLDRAKTHVLHNFDKYFLVGVTVYLANENAKQVRKYNHDIDALQIHIEDQEELLREAGRDLREAWAQNENRFWVNADMGDLDQATFGPVRVDSPAGPMEIQFVE